MFGVTCAIYIKYPLTAEAYGLFYHIASRRLDAA